MNVAENLKRARKEKGCTTEEIARACGITRSAIQMYEAGLRIPRDSLKVEIARYYGKSVEELFF